MTQTRETFDAASSLRIVTCATCGILFAVPESLHIQQSLEPGLIHCPSGHQIPLQKPSKETLNLALVAELAQVKHQLATARKALATLPKIESGPVDDRELKRRLNLLTARSERIGGSQTRLCPICASRHGNERVLRIHLRQKHKRDIRRMPAGDFGKR